TDTIAGFKLLPKGLGQGLSLQQTVQLVRSPLEYFELVMPRITHNERQRGLMIAAVLKFGRELGFTAASVYAAAAENRGAWDTRMEAMIVDAVVRGDRHADLTSGASALNWDPTTPATVIVGSPRTELGLAAVPAVHNAAVSSGRHALAVVQGARLVVILSGRLESPGEIPPAVLDAFAADASVVLGHTVDSLVEAPESAAEALSGATAVNGWPGAPRPAARGLRTGGLRRPGPHRGLARRGPGERRRGALRGHSRERLAGSAPPRLRERSPARAGPRRRPGCGRLVGRADRHPAPGRGP